MSYNESRNYSLIIYCNNISEIISICQSTNNILYYACICHDKEGDIHYHLLLILRSSRRQSTVTNYFRFYVNGILQNVFIQPISDLKKAYEYLYHLNDLSKYQYSKDSIVTNSEYEFLNRNQNIKSDDNTYAIINDLIDKRSLREMVKIYGKELVYRYKQFKELVSDLVEQEEYVYRSQNLFDFQSTNIDELEILK